MRDDDEGPMTGEVKRDVGVRVVGKYSSIDDPMPYRYMVNRDKGGPTATLLANLERERVPPKRVPVVKARYLPGVQIGWDEL